MKIKTLVYKEIKSLMGDQNSFYHIPDYQRPFSWDEEHITDFWEDITKAYENKDDNYFLGSFILIENPASSGFEVVDGQQRLTTITLFLAILRDFFVSNGEAALADKIQNEFIKKDNKYRLYTRTEDRAAFEKNVLEDVRSLQQYRASAMRKQFIHAINVFHELIDLKNEELKSDAKTFMDYMRAVYEYMMGKVIVITVVTEDIASAYTIFETINQRGKELLTEDLLKNFLLKKLLDEVNKHNAEKPNAQKDFEEEKLACLSAWQRIENSDTPMESLLNYHRTALLGTNPKKDLFKELTGYIRDKNVSVHNFMADWEKSVDAYHSLRRGDQYDALSDKTKKILTQLWNMNHTHWIPVLISARRSFMSVENFQNLIFELEKMYALFWIAGYNAVKVKHSSWRLIREYINTNRPFAEIKRQIESLLQENRVYKRFLESLSDNCYGRSWCKYLLAKYEYSLSDNSIIKKIKFDGTMQVEHILPQTMTESYWTDRFTEEQKDNLVGKLGNLTLLIGSSKEKNSSKNQTASNKSFPEKISIYMGKNRKDGVSAFQMTQDLAKYSDWTPEVITERQKTMIDELLAEWQIAATDADAEDESAVSSDNEENNMFSLAKGNYNDIALKRKLLQTLQSTSRVIPRLTAFIQILLSEPRAFSREELQQALYKGGVGETIGRTGALLSNISQFLTKGQNDHLRQIISFEGGSRAGEHKDNYKIVEQYRLLVKEVLDQLS